MPTKSDYLAAAEILEKVADRGYSPQSLFNLYKPFDGRSGMRNILVQGNINWGETEVKAWQDVLRSHEKRLRENVSLDIRSIRVTSSAKKRRLMLHADTMRRKAVLVGMMDKINSSDFLGEVKEPGSRAWMVDFAFVALEPRQVVRHKKLLAIFSEKMTTEDEVWIRLLWDLTRPDIMRRLSMTVSKKYFR